MNLFDSSKLNSDYSKWQDTPDVHEDDSCDSCHESHIKEGVVPKNATEWPAQYPCCVLQFEDMKICGEVCEKHPLSYFEKASKDNPTAYCENCALEDK